MYRAPNRELTVVISQLRAIPVIETGWDKFPCYYEATGKMDFVDSFGRLRTIYKGDFIVWDAHDNFVAKRKNLWTKIYGKFLMEKGEQNV